MRMPEPPTTRSVDASVWSPPLPEAPGFDHLVVETPGLQTLDELIEGLCAMTELQTGPYAARTRARYALFLELTDDPELGEPLRRQRREFERWTERIVIAVGIADPVPATRALMALSDGLLLHRLTVDPTLDMRPAIERALRAIAAG